MDLVECLGVEGTLAPPTEGWGSSVELIGSVASPTLLSLLFTCPQLTEESSVLAAAARMCLHTAHVM